MPQTVIEAAKAARQQVKALAKAIERRTAAEAELAAAVAAVEDLERAQKGIEYSLWAAALGESDAEPQQASAGKK